VIAREVADVGAADQVEREVKNEEGDDGGDGEDR
jgi:hypothetical protein